MTEKQIESKIASIVKIIERYNKKLTELYNKYDTKELYLDRDCMSIPCEITPFDITYHANDRLSVEYRLGKLTTKFDIQPMLTDGELWLMEAYEFSEEIAWCRKRIKSAERFYQSEDPDRYLEENEDED